MRTVVSIMLASTTFVLSCQSGNTERTNGFSDVPKTYLDSLKKEVLDGHDIGMSKMMRINNYLKKVDGALDSLAKLPANKQDTSYKRKLTELKQELVDAEDGMNKWMEAFKLDSAGPSEKETVNYYEGEKSKVKKVTEDIEGALKKADSVVKKN